MRSVSMKVMIQVGSETDVEREIEEAKREQHDPMSTVRHGLSM
jgi:hypothetical protein